MNEDLKKLLEEITDPNSKAAAEALFKNIAGSATEGKKVTSALLTVRRAFIDVNEQAQEFTESFASSLQEITKSNIALGQVRKSTRSLLSISQKLQDSNAGINTLSIKELAALKAKATTEKQRLIDSAKFLKNQLGLNDLKGEDLEKEIQALEASNAISREQASILRQSEEDFANVDRFITSIKLAEQSQAQLNRMTGLTGAALSNLNRIGIRALGGLGINLGALEEDLKEAEAAAINAAEEIRNAAYEAGKVPNEQKARFEALKRALPGIGKALGTALIDPLTIGLVSTKNLFEAFKELDKAQTGFKQLTGDTAGTFQQLTSNAATAVEVIEVASSLTRQLGTNAEAIFGPETLLQITEAKNLLGLTAEQASDLAVLSKVSGVNAESFQQQLDAGADNANRLAGSAISSKIALEDVLSVSDGIQLSLGGSGEKLGEAAVAARALGLELSEVDAIASSLLDFESSIENELQAQLLTGRQLNLTRARELALNNDLAGVASELTSNIVSSTEFSNMNRIAQEGLASAIGVSRDQLARMIIQQDMNKTLTEEARAEMLGLTMEQYASQEAAEALRRSFQGIAQAVAGIVQPILNVVAGQEKLIQGAIVFAGLLKTTTLLQKGFNILSAASAAIELNRLVSLKKGNQLQVELLRQ